MTRFGVCTGDGVRIEGVRFRSRETSAAFVLGHGFCGSWKTLVPLAERLQRRGSVYAFDFRGHGSSAGKSTVGYLEALDVRAVVDLARAECRPDTRIVTVGASMGGIAVIREAATFASADAVVSISAPAQWKGQRLRARMLGTLVTSAFGRALAGRYLGTRIESAWMSPAPPIELVGGIPVPMVFVHGTEDRFVSPLQARLLHDAAGPLSRLCVIDGYGHAEAGFDERVTGIIDGEIAQLGALSAATA